MECSCESRKIQTQREEEDKLIQFLMGLDRRYVHIRGQILAMKDSPSLEKAFSILIQEENKRGNEKERGESMSFLSSGSGTKIQFDATRGKNGEKKKQVCSYCKKVGHTYEVCFQRQKCSHCGKSGHLASDYYHLHGREAVLARKKNHDVEAFTRGEGQSSHQIQTAVNQIQNVPSQTQVVEVINQLSPQLLQQIAGLIQGGSQTSVKEENTTYCNFSGPCYREE